MKQNSNMLTIFTLLFSTTTLFIHATELAKEEVHEIIQTYGRFVKKSTPQEKAMPTKEQVAQITQLSTSNLSKKERGILERFMTIGRLAKNHELVGLQTEIQLFITDIASQGKDTTESFAGNRNMLLSIVINIAKKAIKDPATSTRLSNALKKLLLKPLTQ